MIFISISGFWIQSSLALQLIWVKLFDDLWDFKCFSWFLIFKVREVKLIEVHKSKLCWDLRAWFLRTEFLFYIKKLAFSLILIQVSLYWSFLLFYFKKIKRVWTWDIYILRKIACRKLANILFEKLEFWFSLKYWERLPF